MTGNELREIMHKLHLDGQGMGQLAGISRQRVKQLLDMGDGDVPDETKLKIVKGLIALNHEAASTLLTIGGDAV